MSGFRRFSVVVVMGLMLAATLPLGDGRAAGPSVKLSPSRGASGATINASLAGFPAEAVVRLRWDGVSIAQVTTTSRGKASVTFEGRAATAGRHVVRATAGNTAAEASYTVTSRLQLGSARVRAGNTVDVSLSGFGNGERVVLWLIKGQTQRRVTTVSVGDTGGRNKTVTLPADVAPGSWTFEGRGNSGNSATAKITISGRAATPTATPTATPSPTPIPTQTAVPTQAGGGTVSIWVDPLDGSDEKTGASRSNAVRTLDEAWSRVPMGQTLTVPYRIRLVAGSYPQQGMPNYMEQRYGTTAAPITIEAADGAGTAILNGSLNIYDVSHLSLVNLVIRNSGDVVHCELCRNFSILGTVLDGQGDAHETLKINQSQHIEIDDSDIGGSYENAIDFVAVQYGSITDTKIHDAEDWCIYLKGGSAEFTISGNEIYDCGTGGFSAGQGTGFQFMVSPWLTYEAEEIDFIGNEIHDTEGAGMGVNGGKDILLAENHLVRVGSRSHLLEIAFGSRSCDGQPGDEGRSRCADYLEDGGWGTTAVDNGENYVRIPNKNVIVRDNVFENPAGYQTRWQHFFIPGPFSGSAQNSSNAPKPAYADDGLVITGNTIVNGDASMPLGIGDGQGCADTNPTCNETQLLADNDINGR
ncbi:MAG: right-handed parallel beta-helix repeat-containing protein [Thermomicrobiales bacterium]|nr:right-handed parallel beta-helix repeat-containing protein [Thermomicrobiales bacterium]